MTFDPQPGDRVVIVDPYFSGGVRSVTDAAVVRVTTTKTVVQPDGTTGTHNQRDFSRRPGRGHREIVHDNAYLRPANAPEVAAFRSRAALQGPAFVLSRTAAAVKDGDFGAVDVQAARAALDAIEAALNRRGGAS